MPHRQLLRVAISLAVTAVGLGLIFSLVDLGGLKLALMRLTALTLAEMFIALLAGIFLASLRLRLMASDFGYKLPFLETVRVLALGQLGGSAFFQIVGQTITRGLLLSRKGVPSSVTILIAGYERLLATAVSFSMAGLGAWFLFGRVTLDLKSGGLDLLKLIVAFLLVLLAVSTLVWGSQGQQLLRRLSTINVLQGLGINAVLSLLIQLTTMAAYAFVAKALHPTLPIDGLCAALALVMLAAALPISFAGWGLRELSAVYALGSIGMAPEEAVVAAAMIGGSGIVLLIAVAGASTLISRAHPKSGELAAPANPAPVLVDYDRALMLGIPLAAACAVLFQVWLPIGKTTLNVNLADPLALTGGTMFLLVHIRSRNWPAWRSLSIPYGLGTITFVLAMGLAVAWLTFGLTTWALVNRFAGWLILLGYVGTGALAVKAAGDKGLRLLLQTFAVATSVICALELSFIIAHSVGLPVPDALVPPRIFGLSADPNAFALQICFACAALLALDAGSRRIVLLTILLMGLAFTGSRAGWVALLIVGVAALTLLPDKRRALGYAMASTIGGLALIELLPFAVALLHGLSGAGSAEDAMLLSARGQVSALFDGSHRPTEYSNKERWLSISGGWAVFLQQPIFGAGLGAFVEQHRRLTGTSLVIHSTPVWLLAEFGLVGFLCVAYAAVRLFLTEALRSVLDEAGAFIVLLLVAIGTVALVHDVFFQRAFWFLIGGALLLPACQSAERSITRFHFTERDGLELIPQIIVLALVIGGVAGHLAKAAL